MGQPRRADAEIARSSSGIAPEADRACLYNEHFESKEFLMADVAVPSDLLVLDNFIGGRWGKARASDFFDVHNPATGEVIGRTPLSTAADVDAAVQAATEAFPSWRDTPVNTRAQVLYRLKNQLEQRLDEMARIVT